MYTCTRTKKTTTFMAKARGFRLGRRIVKVFGCFFINRRKRRMVAPSSSCAAVRAMSKLCSWGKSLIGIGATKKRGLCFGKRNSGYIRVGQEEKTLLDGEKVKEVVKNVPKGHLPVYVGEKNDDACRVFVPVIYFNHPLFAELLREAEQVYGFDHQGGIQIPCQKSKFENVKMRIDAVSAANGGDVCRRRRRWRQLLLASGGGNDHLDY